MHNTRTRNHGIIGSICIVIAVFLVAFSFYINTVDNKSLLASGIFQFIEFSLGCLFAYSGLFFLLSAKSTDREIITRITLSIASVIVSLVLLEVSLQIILPQPQFDTRLLLYPHVQKQIEVNLPGVTPIIHYSTNSWGLRGDPAPDEWDRTYTIITIGGSTTASTFIDDDRTWSARLQANLSDSLSPIWVGNAGIDGHSTRGHILMMQEVISEVQPDMVIFLVGINDLGLSLSESADVYGSYADKDQVPILFESHLFRFAWQLGQLALGNVVTKQNAHQAFEAKPIDPDDLSPLPENLEDMLPLLNIYRDNLNQLIDIGEALDLEMLFLTQPLLFDDTTYWQGIEGDTVWLREQDASISAATYWDLMAIYNNTLLDVCEERDVTCFDLASTIPHSEDYFYDMVHFNDHGSALVADSITPIVEDMLAD